MPAFHPTLVRIRGTETSVAKGAPVKFTANRGLGQKPYRTPFTLTLVEGRNRAKGFVTYLK